ncbi:hypothetical protein [Microbaculum marinisediminis]|uniref:Uncharacterized protein n=1 Tax=Microbaculum marinisediminis TaxID=2931392 RepID=A0AAW5R0U0_9HYPH|nr:hypothetical protein [Microbaculum sp. A6E488]MCT8972283.1 hypothetical protein [Microbaculum sp. A6E488]
MVADRGANTKAPALTRFWGEDTPRGLGCRMKKRDQFQRAKYLVRIFKQRGPRVSDGRYMADNRPFIKV